MNTPTSEASQVSELNVVLGGVEFDAKLRDGKSEPVKIRQLPIRVLRKWSELQGDDAALVELYCDKPEGWDDTLLPESHREISRIGKQLNRPLFDQWLEDRHEAIGHLKDLYQRYVPEHPLVKPAEPDSPTSSTSAASS